MWLAPDGNSVLYSTSSVTLQSVSFKENAPHPTRGTNQGDGNSAEKEPRLSLSALYVYQQVGGDVEVGFYSVSATVKLVSCVNATVHINQPKNTDDQGFSSILFGLHSRGGGGRGRVLQLG